MDYRTLPTPDLTAAYNEAFGKNIKIGSYPRAKLIDALTALAQAAEVDAGDEAASTPAVEETWSDADMDRMAADLIGSFVVVEDLNARAEEIIETSAEELQANLDAVFEEGPARDKPEGSCPLCGGDPANQTAAGAEGTFLGEACQFCHDCGKTYNTFTGEEVPADAPATKKRRIINPQSKIDAKTDALAAIGITLFYDRPQRIWTMTNTATAALVLHLSSRDFALYSTKELVEYVKDRGDMNETQEDRDETDGTGE